MQIRLSDRLQNFLGWAVLACIVVLFSAILFWPSPQHKPPIFDVQMHYNREAWTYFNTKSIIGTMKELAILRAAVSSAPNEGTYRLYTEDTYAVLPLLTPYRSIADRHDWYLDQSLIESLNYELNSGFYRGIGEIHLLDGQVQGPVVEFLVREATRRDLVILAHSNTPAIKQLFRMNQNLKILWAHAGMTAQPLMIDSMLFKYPNLYAELSHRTDIMRDGKLKPAWRELFLRYPDRFMIGSGTYNNTYWYEYRYTMGRIRQWLSELPADVAENIAHRNAARLFAFDAT